MAYRPVFILFTALIFGAFLDHVIADKVAKKIYEDIKAIKACVLLTNATHQIGCRSSLGGEVGVVHFVQSDADIQWLLSDKATHAPYIPVFSTEYFQGNFLKKLIAKNKINGALVINTGRYGKAPEQGFSPDYECPMEQFGLYSDNKDWRCKTKWNKGSPCTVQHQVQFSKLTGNAMSFMYFDFPIFALTNADEVNSIISCYNEYNKPVNGTAPDYPLCAAQLKDFMFAAKDTPTCMRKTNTPGPNQNSFCDPLGDKNVWGTLMPIQAPLASNTREVIVLAARMDTTSFFHELAPGVDNDASGVITLLAAAEALGKLKRQGPMADKMLPIVFMLFHGEAWDYIGSSRMVYDMDKGQFPDEDNSWKIGDKTFVMKTKNIKYFLELNQVGLAKDDNLFPHSDVYPDPEVYTLINILNEEGKASNVTFEDPSASVFAPLPPASFQQFLKSDKKIPGVVITDHKTTYTNKYYNSRFDDEYQAEANITSVNGSVHINTKFSARLTRIATTIARSLYHLSTNGQAPLHPIEASEVTVANLAYCIFRTASCPLYKEVFERSVKFPAVPLSRYVGVSNVNSPLNSWTDMVYSLLLYYTGYHKTINSSSECKSVYDDKSYTVRVMRGKSNDSICVNGTVYFSEALSPAFLDTPDYASTKYSTWAESTWNTELSVRIFLQASPATQGTTLAAGLIITLVSFLLVCCIHRNAEKLFMLNEPVSDPSSIERELVN